ncbi:hypothetical protein BJ085DRAFT_38344 [Dimargaris cristalligena]|uniref:RGS domain-containing protein n=1 Tax=Dimargaris cristalligena TaxID=215637 RepID=A0A4Q0A1T3_9FUNG|nr:hypothetical protein BJ085DRAFT_38344 [Dimargaris cristalligena]|eukprot:RKP40007.1 hypothetical protein BJ085DRAFT_38344 [Dimargaris cristalligena]
MGVITYGIDMETLRSLGYVNDMDGRKSALVAAAIIYAIFHISTTYLFYRQAKRNDYLNKRYVNLILVSSVATFFPAVSYTLTAAFPLFPCFVNLWITYVGFLIWGVVLILRSMILVFQRQMNEAQVALDSHQKTHDSISSDGSDPNWNQSISSQQRQDKVTNIRTRLQKIRNRRVQLHDRVIGRALAIGFGASVIAIVIIQILSPIMSISPVNVWCATALFEYVPYYAWQFCFTCIITPILLYLMYGFNDAFGIRNELISLMCVTFFFLPLFLAWYAGAPHLNAVFSAWLWPVISIFICHICTFVVPVIKSRKLQVFQEELSGSKRMIRWQDFSRCLNDPKEFADLSLAASACFCPELVIFLHRYHQFREKVVRYYEGVVSKERTVDESLHQETMVTESKTMSYLHDQATLRDVQITEEQLDIPLQPNDKSSPYVTMISLDLLDAKSTTSGGSCMCDTILKTVRQRLSIQELFQSETSLPQLPVSLQRNLHELYSTFIQPEADLAININFTATHAITTAIENKHYSITMFDEAHRETLQMLYFNVYPRYIL